MSAGGDICLGTQGMALLSAQIHLEDATRRRTNYPAATVVARANCRTLSLGENSHVGKTTLYTFLHKDKESGGDLYRHTRHHQKYRHKPLASPPKGKWGRRKSIDERPDSIDRKERWRFRNGSYHRSSSTRSHPYPD